MHKKNTYKRFVLLTLLLTYAAAYASAQVHFEAVTGKTSTFNVVEHEGSVYEWEVYTVTGFNDPASGEDAQIINGDGEYSADIEWGSEGEYYVVVTETDVTGCTNTKALRVKVSSSAVAVDAGSDLRTGACLPVQLSATVGEQQDVTWSYLWEPATGLDDPTLQNPFFTPGQTTTFRVTATNNLGESASDEVTVVVSAPVANAGSDIVMYKGETAMLDGSLSDGDEIDYQWFAGEGAIVSGENTAQPVIGGFGDYILQVTDGYGCVAYDTVKVEMLTRVPVAADDYDTAQYRAPLKIYVLSNDYDEDNDLDSSSVRITVPPMHGNAVAGQADFSILYTPGRNFAGNDYFEYSICDLTNNCDQATVHVMVNDFHFQVPEAFSPNNDGINDYFEIPGIEYYEGNSIEIFNRWGRSVYRAENYGISATPRFWDGKKHTGSRSGSEHLPAGTYFYLLDLGNGEKRIAGSVYLKR